MNISTIKIFILGCLKNAPPPSDYCWHSNMATTWGWIKAKSRRRGVANDKGVQTTRKGVRQQIDIQKFFGLP